jgi:hypothetical protein
MEVVHIQKGKPQQNGFAERFNEPFRYEFLGAYLFDSLSQVREMVWLWRLDYNDERLHKFRGICRPVAICRRWKTLVQRCLTKRGSGHLGEAASRHNCRRAGCRPL